jgi:hypothetical protein
MAWDLDEVAAAREGLRTAPSAFRGPPEFVTHHPHDQATEAQETRRRLGEEAEGGLKHPVPPPARSFAVAAAVLPSGADDRPLRADVSTAAELPADLARL